jgi:hypothetical protein
VVVVVVEGCGSVVDVRAGVEVFDVVGVLFVPDAPAVDDVVEPEAPATEVVVTPC